MGEIRYQSYELKDVDFLVCEYEFEGRKYPVEMLVADVDELPARLAALSKTGQALGFTMDSEKSQLSYGLAVKVFIAGLLFGGAMGWLAGYLIA